MGLEAGYKYFDDIPYRLRFSDAVRAIVGATPPNNLVGDWLNHIDRDDDLCQWVGSAPNAPTWVQNIAVLDAAKAMADAPCEGAV
jgi:hypothetical protein